MPTTTENQPLAEALAEHEASGSLVPQIDPRWSLSPWQAMLVGLVAAIFLVANYLPLQSPELWGQVVYGRWILTHRALPSEDPAMPLAEGMPVIDSQWLAQVLLAAVASFGEQWLSVLFAITLVATFVTLAGTYSVLSRSGGVGVIMASAVLIGSWTQYAGFQPQHLAGLCFAACLALLAWNERMGAQSDSAVPGSPIRSIANWAACFALFVLWANLDPSFIWGIASIACFLFGRAIDVVWRDRSVSSVFRDRTVRRWLILMEIALAATLINPYGINLLVETVWFSRNENVNELAYHQPLVLLGSPGREFAISVVVLLISLRASRAPLRVSYALLLGVLAIATIVHQSMFGWYMMAFGYVIVGLFAEIWSRLCPPRQKLSRVIETSGAASERPATTWVYTLIALVVVWIAFSLSDASKPLLGGKSRTLSQLYGSRAPLALTNYLRDNPSNDVVFCPLWWSDWLVLHGPKEFRPLVTSHVEAVPRTVWRDYHRIESAESGWQRVLERYRINTVLADQERQRTLIRIIRGDPDWTQTYRDEQSIVFKRRANNRTREGSPKVEGFAGARITTRSL